MHGILRLARITAFAKLTRKISLFGNNAATVPIAV
jgi:hypothetical protein